FDTRATVRIGEDIGRKNAHAARNGMDHRNDRDRARQRSIPHIFTPAKRYADGVSAARAALKLPHALPSIRPRMYAPHRET
ncbi:hypothetical protein, partial [Burkholderia pseudomallei]|uniref:hypothetical protein n=1 Tax=Burkholderia pseudomallei TaxID=28450 RepID=UPI0021F74F12